MKTNSEIRKEARSLMSGNWGSAVLLTLVYLIIVGGISFTVSFVGTIVEMQVNDYGITSQILSLFTNLFISFPLAFSLVLLYVGFVRGENRLSVGGIFKAFKSPHYLNSIGVYFLMGLFTALWTMLFIIPGIIKSLSYALAPYILADNPELSANEAIDESIAMMKGHKADLFLIQLGYAALAILSLLALGIPLLWLDPYYKVVYAKFYEEVKAEYNGTIATE